MMQRVHRCYCERLEISDPIHRADIAARILTLFDMGLRSEEALMTRLLDQTRMR